MPRHYYNDELSILEGRGIEGRVNETTGEWEYVDRYGRTTSEVLEDYQERTNRLNAICGVYQRADRIITGQDVKVEVTTDPEVTEPASNTGKTIVFSANAVGELDDDSIISLHGLNYHEVSHLLFSPRAGSNLAQYVTQNNLKRAFFILEEARAENMFVTKYPVTRLFLEATINKYLLNDPENIGAYFPLITGRKYLPIETRQAVADQALNMFDKATLVDIHKIIHEYRELVFPRDFDKAKELSLRLSAYVGRDEEKPETQQWETGHNFLKEGRPANTSEQERLQDRAKNKPSDTESLEGSDDNAKPSDGDTPSNGEGGADDKPMDLEQTIFTDKDSRIAQLLNERMESIKSDRFVKRELSDTRKAILGSDEMRTAMRATNYLDMAISPNAQVIARKFAQELERMVRDQDPAWESERPYGKLNPKRTMTPDINAIGRVFDRWDIGNENTDIEAVILMDNSSSMGREIRAVCENAWIIKRGIESIYGSVTAYSFNHESRMLYDSNERAKPNTYRYVQSSGNTNPIRALMEAERLLTSTKKHIKLLFIVTDGEWGMEKECDRVVKRLNDNGVITCIVYLDDYGNYQRLLEEKRSTDPQVAEYIDRRLHSLNHGVKLFKAVAQPRDVLGVATSLVKELITSERVA